MAFAQVSDYEVLHGSEVDPAKVQAELNRATAAIQSMCRQALTRATSTVAIKGTWDREILLPERPVVSVSDVTVNGRAVEGFEVTGRSLLWSSSTRFLGGARAGFPANWGGPDCLVGFTYTHGFDPIPDDLVALCVDMAAMSISVPVGARTESTSLGSYQESIAYDLKGEAVKPLLSAVIGRYGQ